ncbi:probable BOI-related E3 ubiquitin-protein ligase 3 isoform X2 [Setaria italica]|uniref:probable BOI-related E3 ubiquitin-protein ligase 3 isoform X2 n=1 Tax=Setaria italica TaxID=4555 RepID=UPI000350FA2D|nr:probable BOI-related E3 ubiquitin-protein ligase 3 isoform X2 [Setaria italica]
MWECIWASERKSTLLRTQNATELEGQQANGLPLDGINPVPFGFSLEQHRLQLDQVLQLYNEQVRVSLQQEMSIQNLTLLNLRTTDALIQKVEEVASLKEEVASLHVELQRKQGDIEAAQQFAVMVLETNESLIHRPPPMQQEMNLHISSNQSDAPGSGNEASSVVRTAAETTKIDLICKVCNFGLACMLLLPCQHLCACNPCGVRLAACPICGAVKGGAVEARFV